MNEKVAVGGQQLLFLAKQLRKVISGEGLAKELKGKALRFDLSDNDRWALVSFDQDSEAKREVVLASLNPRERMMVEELREWLQVYADCPEGEQKMYGSAYESLRLLGMDRLVEMPKPDPEEARGVLPGWSTRIPGVIFHGGGSLDSMRP